MADTQTIDEIINDVDNAALAWYSVISGKPAVPPNASPQQVQAQVLATASQQAPTTALLVSNPTFLIGIVAVLIVAFFLLKD